MRTRLPPLSSGRWPALVAVLATALIHGSCTCGDGPRTIEATRFDPIATQATVLSLVAANAPPAIYPIQRGELQPPPGGVATGPGLHVLAVGPQGEQVQPMQAVVVFDRPMVALGALDDAAAAPPLSCGPGVAGQARWAGTSTAVWVPEGDQGFPKATEVRCTVPGRTQALTGESLGEDLDFVFLTPAPSIARHWPRDTERSHDPAEGILLVFDQPVDPAAVAAASTLRTRGGPRVPLTGSRPPADDEDWRLPDEPERAVLLEGPLDRNTAYTLTVDSGLRGLEGPRPMPADKSFSFHTIPPAAIERAEPRGSDVDPYALIELHLATRTAGEAISPRVRISPTPPDGWEPAESYSSTRWSHGVRLEPTTTYTVTVEPGFEDEYGQVLEQGLSWSFTTGHHAPMLDVASGPQLYPANNPPTLPLRSRNLRHLEARVSPVSVEWVLANLDEYRTYASTEGLLDLPTFYTEATDPSGQTFPLAVPGLRANLARELAVDDAIHLHEVPLEPVLREGRGLVMAEVWSNDRPSYRGPPYVERALLQVTDLGTTIKAGPNGVETWVTRLSDGLPVADAEVALYLEGREVWSGSTGTSGLATAPDVVPQGWNPGNLPLLAVVRYGADTAVTTTSHRNAAYLWSYPVQAGDPGEAAEIRVHAFAERGVYRQGETAHLAATGRIAHAQGLSLFPAGGVVEYRCDDEQGSELSQGNLAADAHGAVAFDLPIPATAALGVARCGLTWKAEGIEGYASVPLPIQAYRSPTFRVDVSAPEHAVAGGTLEATGHGRYLFGAPMAGAEARWSISELQVDPAPEGWDDYLFGARTAAWWEDEYRSESRLASGEGTLDNQGQLPIQAALPATEQPSTRLVTVELEVTDVARQQIANRSQLLVHPAETYAGLRFGAGLGEAGQPSRVDLVAVSPAGRIVEGVTLEVQVLRRRWDCIRKKGMDGRWTWETTSTDEPVESQTLTSKGSPLAFDWTPPEGGFYVVQVSARDAQGRLARTEGGQYVAGAGATWARSDTNELKLMPDKRRYQPGELARVLVQSPRPGLKALVTVEREGVLDSRVVTLHGTAETLEIPLGEDAVPNVFLSVVAVEGAPPVDSPEGTMPAWYLGYTTLPVEPVGRRLSVDLATDATQYQPGQPLTATVEVQRNGAPVPGAHVVLWAVDYGVLSLTGYDTPDAFATYYEPRPLRVRTADGRTRVLDRARYLVKGGRSAGGGGEGMGDTRSNFVTTPFWAPDLVTGPDGTVTATFTLPDNLTTFQLMAVVDQGAEAYGSGDKQVQVTRPLIAQPALPRTLRQGDAALAGVVVHNNRDQERRVQVTAQASGVSLSGSPATVTVPARGAVEVPFDLFDPQPGLAELSFEAVAGEDRDAVVVTLPVERPVPVETVVTAGYAEGEVRETIAPIDGAIAGAGGLEVRLSPTVLVGADTALGYLLDYRWSCLEQTSSRLVAALVARDLGTRAGLDLTAEELDTRIAAHLAKLEEFRHPSGGLSLWPDALYPNAVATAYAMEVRAMAGQAPDRETVRFLREFLRGDWTPTYWDAETALGARVRAALALARVGQGDSGHNARLYAQRNALPLVARAELAEAIARTSGADSRTAQLLKDVEGGLYTEATAAWIVEPEGQHTVWGAEMTATAAAIEAMLTARPDHPLLPRLVQGLVRTRRAGAWGNTYTTARALRALLGYVARFEQAEGSPSAGVTLAHRTLLAQTVLSGGAIEATVPIDDEPWGELLIDAQGGRVYYETRLSYATAQMPARDQGFTLTRTYRLVEGSGTTASVTPGALVRVDLRVTTPVDRTDVVLNDPLPAGLEPVNTFFRTTALAMQDMEGEEQEDARWWSSWVFSHRAMGDAEVTLFADYMPAGVHVYSYLARATTPGDYSQPAARVEQMYSPEVFGRTEMGRFVVGKTPVAQAP